MDFDMEGGMKTPSKGSKSASASLPSTAKPRSSSKNSSKNLKITNFFSKVNSPLTRKIDNSNNDQSENDNQQADELSKDAASPSMRMPESCANDTQKKKAIANKEYVFIISSSDDDTNISTRGSVRRRKPPSIHSSDSESSVELIPTTANNEPGLVPEKRPHDLENIDKLETKSGTNANKTAESPRLDGIVRRKWSPKRKKPASDEVVEDGIIGMKVRSPTNNGRV